ncbi:hypothetical protein AK812_SmicGene28000 [Symbiodinium microadriaticum]|uniref:Uncharacterized protein n=1 Tax=Symbiodinium microadriaticum TaxID=2951 RepID=A0A1Q9D5H0_SYMMI|nr:hypothetical protein AK812_SmicGene28000 [Symbiodinium microadriaticum]
MAHFCHLTAKAILRKNDLWRSAILCQVKTLGLDQPVEEPVQKPVEMSVDRSPWKTSARQCSLQSERPQATAALENRTASTHPYTPVVKAVAIDEDHFSDSDQGGKGTAQVSPQNFNTFGHQALTLDTDVTGNHQLDTRGLIPLRRSVQQPILQVERNNEPVGQWSVRAHTEDAGGDLKMSLDATAGVAPATNLSLADKVRGVRVASTSHSTLKSNRLPHLPFPELRAKAAKAREAPTLPEALAQSSDARMQDFYVSRILVFLFAAFEVGITICCNDGFVEETQHLASRTVGKLGQVADIAGKAMVNLKNAVQTGTVFLHRGRL